jgi:hypothetical protein
MTVKELIEKLQLLPQDAQVLLFQEDSDDGWDSLSIVGYHKQTNEVLLS